MTGKIVDKPEILAPAGGRAAFAAALAAGADAVYCGMKRFSARMAAENFTPAELAALGGMARERGVKVYVAFNTLIKPAEMDDAGALIRELAETVRPEALIVSDPAMASLASQAGFRGDIHLSTLANVSFPGALQTISHLPQVNRVVLPRELSVDEIRQMAGACPARLSLEVFVHGALCYAVSGRCYWSSYLGGKSGLRGNCVQPCRRIYAQENKRARFFSCQDLWVDVLVKVLLTIPGISALKIEGRKKGPHYVYYVTRAYRMLCDHSGDSQAKKEALACLDYAMGRGGTHYHFLPQRFFNPIDIESATASGRLVGKIQGSMLKPYIEPREPLFAKDVLRVGYEDAPGHKTLRVTKSVPKRGRLFLNLSRKERAVNKTPVFLIDRREPDLEAAIDDIAQQAPPAQNDSGPKPGFSARVPKPGGSKKMRPFHMHVHRRPPERSPDASSAKDAAGVWVHTGVTRISPRHAKETWWWLPPVVWPEKADELGAAVDRIRKAGATRFVINAPWQMAFLSRGKNLDVWAGPFCNAANPITVGILGDMGCAGVIVSPELGREDYLRMVRESPLPLGIVVYGSWPLCISRIKADALKEGLPFESPKKEHAWVSRHGEDYWVFPEWPVDLRDSVEPLRKAGYGMFVHLHEDFPRTLSPKKRPGRWNYEHGLK